MNRFPRVTKLLAVSLVVVMASGCGAATSSAGGETAAAPSRSKDRLEGDDLVAHEYTSVSQAILATHADWMTPARGVASLPMGGKGAPTPMVGVFVDGSHRAVTLEELKTIKPETVKSIRHLSASDSRTEYGADWQWGAIVVSMVR